MRIIALLTLMLAGCNYSYEVTTRTVETCTAKVTEVFFVCKQVTPMFMWNSDVRICKTLDECNQFCNDQLLKKD